MILLKWNRCAIGFGEKCGGQEHIALVFDPCPFLYVQHLIDPCLISQQALSMGFDTPANLGFVHEAKAVVLREQSPNGLKF